MPSNVQYTMSLRAHTEAGPEISSAILYMSNNEVATATAKALIRATSADEVSCEVRCLRRMDDSDAKAMLPLVRIRAKKVFSQDGSRYEFTDTWI